MHRNSSRALNIFGGDEATHVQINKLAQTGSKQQESFGQRVINRSEHGDFGLQRNSSRVLAAPGGHSSLNIFGGDVSTTSAQRPTTSVLEPVVSHKQDSFGQRVINRSEHGDFGLQRNSSRVLAAPGGKSNFSFGDSDEQKPDVCRAKSEEPPLARGIDVPCLPQRAESLPAGQRIVNRSQHNGMQERSSTRIHSAPGGHSTINLGTDSSCVDTRKATLLARRAQVPFAETTNHVSNE